MRIVGPCSRGLLLVFAFVTALAGLNGCGKSGGTNLKVTEDWVYKGTAYLEWEEVSWDWGSKGSAKCPGSSPTVTVEMTLHPDGTLNGWVSGWPLCSMAVDNAGQIVNNPVWASNAGFDIEGVYKTDGTFHYKPVGDAKYGSDYNLNEKDANWSFDWTDTLPALSGVGNWALKGKTTFKLTRTR